MSLLETVSRLCDHRCDLHTTLMMVVVFRGQFYPHLRLAMIWRLSNAELLLPMIAAAKISLIILQNYKALKSGDYDQQNPVL